MDYARRWAESLGRELGRKVSGKKPDIDYSSQHTLGTSEFCMEYRPKNPDRIRIVAFYFPSAEKIGEILDAKRIPYDVTYWEDGDADILIWNVPQTCYKQ